MYHLSAYAKKVGTVFFVQSVGFFFFLYYYFLSTSHVYFFLQKQFVRLIAIKRADTANRLVNVNVVSVGRGQRVKIAKCCRAVGMESAQNHWNANALKDTLEFYVQLVSCTFFVDDANSS